MIIDNHVHIAGPPHNDEMLDFPVYDGRTCLRVPDADIIIGHMGFPRYMDLLTVAQIPGVYVESSWCLTGIAELHGLEFTAKYLRMVGVDNVLFGSDWCGKQVGMEQQKQLDLIHRLDLNREEKDKILGENISKLLCL